MEQLAWLPIHSDFAAALRGTRAEADTERRLTHLCGLAGYQRDFVSTEKLDRTLQATLSALAPADRPAVLPLRQARLAVLSSHTIDHLMPAIRVGGLAHGVILSTHVGHYGTYRQSLMEVDPDLVILDFLMPGMSGAEVAAHILAAKPKQRILFVSGYSETDAIRKVAPDAEILAKPFRAATLDEAVRDALASD